MTQSRGIRSALMTVALTAACLLAAGGLAGPAQAGTTPVKSETKSETVVSTTAASFAGLVADSDKAGAAKPRAATVKRSSAPDATINAPLPGFCEIVGFGPTAVLYCSVVIPATVYVFCDTGNYFYGFIPGAGIWEVRAFPCFVYDYALV